ncbi:MAG: T9SS type A sorting domain-containing protein [Paludibacter sp.]|nr:T9SS type A sorting domain-containing protein [Paludibacter sp.]
MKNSLRFAFFAMLLCISNASFGQILEWQFFSSTTGQEATYNATTNNANLETSVLTRGAGAAASGTVAAKTFLSTMTPSADKAAAIINNAYFQFTVKPKTGYYVSLTDLDLSLRISSVTLSAINYQFQYSLDGTNFNDIGSPTTLTDIATSGVFQPTIDLAQFANLKNVSSSTTITFRLYAWGGTTGSFGLGLSYSASVPSLIVGGVVSNAIATVSGDPKIEGWEFSTTPAGATVNATSQNANLNYPVLSSGAGFASTGGFNYSYVATLKTTTSTKAIAISDNVYFQVTIPPATGYKVSLSTLKYRFRAPNSSTNFRWAYSVDNGYTFTEIGSDILSPNISGGLDYQLDLSGVAALQNVPSTLILRMYVWNTTGTAATVGFGRIISGSNTGAPVNAVYLRGKVETLPALDQMEITVETTDNFQKKTLINDVLYFTNRVYTAFNVPSTLANYEFLSSNAGSTSDGITPTGTIISSTAGDIYVLARTINGVTGWTLVPTTEFFYASNSTTTAGMSVFKKTVTAGQRVEIPVVDNFQEAKPFAKMINYNVFRSVGSGNWNDNTKWEVSSDNVNWSSAVSAPTSGASAILIPAGQGLIVNTPASASIVTLNPTSKLTVNTETSFDATTLNLNSDATGTATFIDKGTSTITTANVQQYLNTARNWYISSPIASATVSSNITFYSYDESGSNTGYAAPATANWVSAPEGSSITVGKGYIAQPSGVTTLTFAGALNNNSTYSIPVTKSVVPSKAGFNLVGNPYPAYIDWSLVITDVENANIGTTMWYRTKNTGDVYTFATHNGTSGVTVTGTAYTTITKFIPPMQSFWIRVNDGTSSTNLKIKKTMLDHRDVSGNTMKAPKLVNNQLIRLQVSNGVNTDESVLCFNPNAVDGLDNYDSPKMSNNNSAIPEIYTVVGNEELVINGLNNSNLERVVPLGFRTGESNSFSIKISEIQNFDSNAQVLLRDNTENKEQEITSETAYNFSSGATSTTNRFTVILRTKGSATELKKTETYHFSVRVNENKKIEITGTNDIEGSATIEIYNVSGQKLANYILIKDTKVVYTPTINGLYFVVVNENGKKISEKLLIN